MPGVNAFARARSAVLDALTGDVTSRVSAYYDPDSNYAGATFLAIEPNEPLRITAADLFAVRLLNVDIGARVTRRLLADGQLTDLLQNVPTNIRLEDADAEALDKAGRCYEAVKGLFADPGAKRSDVWVAPAKLMARKRPWLLPVRDWTVRQFLGFERPYSYRVEWEVYQKLMCDDEIRGLLNELAAPEPPLRVLDVALWTKARQSDADPA